MKKIKLTQQEEQLFLQCVKNNKNLYEISRQLYKDPDVIRRLARDYNVKYLQEHYNYTNEQCKKISYYYEHTNLNIQQISKKLKLRDVAGYIWETYSPKYRQERHKRLLSEQKKGKLNPMYNKKGVMHPNYKGLCDDGNGYFTVIKPEWYTGRLKQKKVFYHHVIMCEHLGLTQIPEGFCVHHIDFNKKNNSIDNLALMTISAHGKLHSQLKKL